MKTRMLLIVIALLIAATESSSEGVASETEESVRVTIQEFYSGTDPIWIYGVSGRNSHPCKIDTNITKSGTNTFFRRYSHDGSGWRWNSITAQLSGESDTFTVSYDDGERHSEKMLAASTNGDCALFEVAVRNTGAINTPLQKTRLRNFRPTSEIDFRVKRTDGHQQSFRKICFSSVVNKARKERKLPDSVQIEDFANIRCSQLCQGDAHCPEMLREAFN
uniref:Putative lipocalin-3 1 n=1 Tax=Amblyomma cajennense TaxID=34607 RepID=A0A023FFL0_AMBCJ